MRKLPIGMLLAALLCAPATGRGGRVASEEPLRSAGPGHSIVTLETRTGVTLRVLLIQPLQPRAAVLLFTGGTGAVGIRPTGIENESGLLAQGRELLARAGLMVALPDLPSDRDGPFGMTGFRTGREHAEDAAAVIGLLRQRADVPVWAVGSSRGSVSAANAAARLEGRARPDGVVLMSSLLVPAGPADGDTVFNLSLGRIHGPVLMMHHRQDACPATPYGELTRLAEALSQATPREVKTYTGGGPPSGAPCSSTHHHGFVGIAPQIIGDLGHWVLAHAPRQAGHPLRPRGG